MPSHGSTRPELLGDEDLLEPPELRPPGKGLNVGFEDVGLLLGGEDEPLVCGCGIEEQGHASPRLTPFMAVLLSGQIDARPDMRTFQSVGRGTIGMLEA